jgi:hypothetical protein
LTVSTTPLPLRLLVVARGVRLFELRFVVVLRLFADRAVVFVADGLRAVDFLAVVDRFVLVRGVLAAIEYLLHPPAIPCLSAYPISAAKTQCARSCTAPGW